MNTIQYQANPMNETQKLVIWEKIIHKVSQNQTLASKYEPNRAKIVFGIGRKKPHFLVLTADE